MKRFGFTLAEVLITLGIIGVISAIVIPQLIANTQKVRTLTKIKKFYSQINNAVKLSANENGIDVDGWVEPNTNYNKAKMTKFIETYFTPYMNIQSYRTVEKNPRCPNSERMLIVLNDGTAFSILVDTNGLDIFFHPDPEKNYFADPRYSFAFQLAKKKSDKIKDQYNSMDFVQPYIYNWDGSRSQLLNDTTRGCNRKAQSMQYCTKLIEMNNWKFPDDYPW
jgi:prepilin-type N-terminal cleavage/methylation domain-containing protein